MRVLTVTGVQTCALPISTAPALGVNNGGNNRRILFVSNRVEPAATEIYSMNLDWSGVQRLMIEREPCMESIYIPEFISTNKEQVYDFDLCRLCFIYRIIV